MIGFVESGERVLSCKNQEYVIKKDNVLLFNPGDNHACVQSDDGTLDYRGINITKEALLILIFLLTQEYGQPFESCIPECREEIERACDFMKEHFAGRICLEQICRHVGLSKSTLLRAFAKSKGVTPYNYLENIRIREARKLLERGVLPVDAALQTGFF